MSKGQKEDTEEKLAVGDRVMIRYIDDERAPPESYILSDKNDDPRNGVLSLLSPLGRAPSEAAPGDEFTCAMAIANELFSLSLWSVNRLRPHELWCPRSQG